DQVIWDARSPAEHRGDKVLAARGGHIPGAINFEWTAGMDPQHGLRLRADLAAQLQALGITPDRDVVTHCQTHHRSGFTYLAATSLGYRRVRAYAGSWAESGNHPDTPIDLWDLYMRVRLCITSQYLLPLHRLSRLAGGLANCTWS